MVLLLKVNVVSVEGMPKGGVLPPFAAIVGTKAAQGHSKETIKERWVIGKKGLGGEAAGAAPLHVLTCNNIAGEV